MTSFWKHPFLWLKILFRGPGLMDWAESLLCNAKPMGHCSQADWDKAVTAWRDQKHGL